MAEKLQKTLNVQPTVASLGNPLPPDQTTSRAIEAAGGLARTFVAEKKRNDLEEGLRELGDEVFAARTGKQLDKVSERFKALQSAKEQGTMTDTMVNIQAEKVLKETIGNMPGFGPELRQEAARILGFDPTGSEIRSLFGSGEAKRPQTQLEKWQDQASAIEIATGGTISASSALKNIGKAAALDSQTKIAQGSLQIGNINNASFLQAHINHSQSYVMDAVADIQALTAQGGVVDPVQQLAILTQKQEEGFARYQQGLFAAGSVSTAADLSAARKTYNESYQGVKDMIQSGDMAEILKTNAGKLSDVASIEAYNALPTLAVLSKVNAVEPFLNALTGIQSEKQLELVKKLDPALGLVLGNDPAARAKGFASAFMQVQGVDPLASGVSLTDVVVPDEAVVDAVTSELIKSNASDEVKDNLARTTAARGKAYKELSFYAQPNVRATATPLMVGNVVERWGVEFQPLVGRIAATIEASQGRHELVVDGGEIRVVQKSVGVSIPSAAGGQFGLGAGRRAGKGALLPVSGALSADVARLNTHNKLVKTGWGPDVGESPVGFLERTVNKIDTLRATDDTISKPVQTQAAFEAAVSSPTSDNLDALRLLDPELVKLVEQELLQRGATSGESESD